MDNLYTKFGGNEVTRKWTEYDKQQATKKNKLAEKKQKAAEKQTTAWQKDYRNQVLALLKPYTTAMTALPKEFQSLITQLEKQSTSNPLTADEMVQTLAGKYSPTFHPATPTGNKTLNKAEATAVQTAETLAGKTGPEAQALSTMAKAGKQYAQAAPYQDILKALLGHVQYNTMYGTGVQGILPAASAWPEWLKNIYGSVTNVGTQGAKGLGLTTGITKAAKKTKGTTPTNTTTTATGE